MAAQPDSSSRSRLLARARRVAGLALLSGAFALAGIVLVPALLGYQRYVIVSGSMTGTYDRGSLVFDRVVPTSTLLVGDVITFRPPGVDHVITHRIVKVEVLGGRRAFTTRGDFNESPDVWSPLDLRQPRQAKVAFGVPYVGYGFALLSDRRARVALIGVPAILIALATLAGLWRETGEPVPAEGA